METVMDYEKHKERHAKLHKALDELIADFVTRTGKRLSNSTVMELIEWSAEQTRNPDETVTYGQEEGV